MNPSLSEWHVNGDAKRDTRAALSRYRHRGSGRRSVALPAAPAARTERGNRSRELFGRDLTPLGTRADTYLPVSSEATTYTLKEAAEMVGVAPITLKRWLLAGKVAEVARDRNNWRRFTREDIKRIERFARTLVLPKKKK